MTPIDPFVGATDYQKQDNDQHETHRSGADDRRANARSLRIGEVFGDVVNYFQDAYGSAHLSGTGIHVLNGSESLHDIDVATLPANDSKGYTGHESRVGQVRHQDPLVSGTRIQRRADQRRVRAVDDLTARTEEINLRNPQSKGDVLGKCIKDVRIYLREGCAGVLLPARQPDRVAKQLNEVHGFIPTPGLAAQDEAVLGEAHEQERRNDSHGGYGHNAGHQEVPNKGESGRNVCDVQTVSVPVPVSFDLCCHVLTEDQIVRTNVSCRRT